MFNEPQGVDTNLQHETPVDVLILRPPVVIGVGLLGQHLHHRAQGARPHNLAHRQVGLLEGCPRHLMKDLAGAPGGLHDLVQRLLGHRAGFLGIDMPARLQAPDGLLCLIATAG